MSYVTKYRIPFESKRGMSGEVLLQKDGYSGSVYELKPYRNGIRIEYKFSDWFKPIIGQSCSIRILNDASFWEYSDMWAADEKEWKMVVNASDNYGNSKILFDGWIDSEATKVRYLENSEISLTGSNYISKLKGYYPSIVETKQTTELINYVNESLKLTGKDASIYVNCLLEPSINGVSILQSYGAMQKIGVNSENFWKGDTDREDALTIIDSILTPFNSYIYWWNDVWYIERYRDIIEERGKWFRTYDPNTTYNFHTPNGILSMGVDDSSYNLSDFDFTSYSQQIEIDPGLNKFIIKKKLNEYENLVTSNFKYNYDLGELGHANPGCTSTNLEVPRYINPPIRGIKYFVNDEFTEYGFITWGSGQKGWISPWARGLPMKDINNSIMRYGTPPGGVSSMIPLINFKFQCTVVDHDYDPSVNHGGTSLSIDYKWMPNLADSPYVHRDRSYTYKHRWYLYTKSQSDFSSLNPNVDTGGFIKFDENTNEWYYVQYEFADDDYFNITETSGSDFDVLRFKDIKSSNVSISLDLGDVSGLLPGNHTFIFGVGLETMEMSTSSYTWPTDHTPFSAHYGDFVVAVDNWKVDNTLVGTINNNVLKDKTITLLCSDVSSLNSPSGMMNASTGERTWEWTQYWDRSETNELAKWLIKDRFSLYGKHRKKINGDILYDSFLKPFSIIYDDYDPNNTPYVLTGYKYEPILDKYSIDLWEYGREEIILE